MTMKTTPVKRVPTRFARPTRFGVKPGPEHATRAHRDAQLEAMKRLLLAGHLSTHATPKLAPALRRAADEAASLAWVTPFPLLVLPVLLEEKVAAARQHAERQALVLDRTAGFLATAA
jgi:hypothetical protein